MAYLFLILLQMKDGLHSAVYLYQSEKKKILPARKICPVLTAPKTRPLCRALSASVPERIFLRPFFCQTMFFSFLLVFPGVP
jgi:hypothetical protein